VFVRFAAFVGICCALVLAQGTPQDVPRDQCGVAAILNDDDRLELFSLGYDSQMYHIWQNSDGTWSNWVGIGGNFTTGAQTIRNNDSRVEIFAVGADDQLYHNWQLTPGGPFQTFWTSLGGPFAESPSVLMDAEGNIVIFARGKISRSLMYNHQVHNASAVFWAGWVNLGGILTSSPSAVLTAESMIHVFVRGVDKGLFEKKQVPTFSGNVAWNKYDGLGGLLASHPSVPAALNPLNLLEVYVRQADRAIWYKRQLATTNETDHVVWSEWQSIGGKMASGPIVVVDRDGFIEVFARGMNSEIFVKSQKVHDSPQYLLWSSLGGESASSPTAIVQGSGAIHLFYRGMDQRIYYRAKTAIGQPYGWSGNWTLLQNNNDVDATFQLYPC